MKQFFDRLEHAIRKRNPKALDLLQPGLPREGIRQMLAAEVKGDVEPVVGLFAWRNGSRLGPEVTLNEASLFPDSVYVFMDFQTMFDHFREFSGSFIFHPKYGEVDRLYFPVFWDNATGYLAVAVQSAKHQVVLLDPESEDLARQVYNSFEEFFEDVIRANEENDHLRCFQIG